MTQQALIIKLVVNAWETQNNRVDSLLTKLSDDQLANHTATNRNSGVYLLGHLAAVSDSMMTFLDFGERLHPELDEIFLKNPENAGLDKPSLAQLKEYWKSINETLTKHMSGMTPDQWLEKHSAVSAEDFAKEPHRNKLNLLISRTNHQSYHLGQLAYL